MLEIVSPEIRDELDFLLERTEKLSFDETYLKALTKITNSAEKERSIGPIFEIVDRHNNLLRISVVRAANQKMSKPRSPVKERMTYFLIAQDEQGIPVGIKECFINKSDGGNELIVKGSIESGQRNRGVSTSIELANLLYLQSESAKYQAPYVLTMVNRNDQDLEAIEASYQENTNPVLAAEVARKKQENLRWHAVYGPRGKIGLNEQGIRKIEGSTEKIVADGTVSMVEKNFDNPQVLRSEELSVDELTNMMKEWAFYAEQVRLTIELDRSELNSQYERLVQKSLQ